MGNAKSDQGAKDFFYGVCGILERGANTAISTMTLPQQLLKAGTDFISSPMGSILIQIVAIGGLYVVSQVVKK
jgi:hypothetical protein